MIAIFFVATEATVKQSPTATKCARERSLVRLGLEFVSEEAVCLDRGLVANIDPLSLFF